MITYNGNVLNCGGWLNAVPTPCPTTLPANTLRCRFVEGTAPVSTYGTWTKVVGVEDNLWDFYRSNNSWSSALSGEVNMTDVVAAGDLSSVTYTDGLFANCTKLKSVCDLDLQASTLMSNMFFNCQNLLHAPNIITGNGLTSTYKMFGGCSSLLDVPLYNTSHVTKMDYMFYGCSALTAIPLYNTASVTEMSSMFSGCRSLVSVPDFNTANVMYMLNMFYDCRALVEAPDLDTSSVTHMGAMFNGCYSLKEVPLYDTHLVWNVSEMFFYCYKVESGSLALYQQMSTQQYPPTSYSNCFTNCGIDTVTGAAELAQIPTSWGGTMS